MHSFHRYLQVPLIHREELPLLSGARKLRKGFPGKGIHDLTSESF